MGRERLQMIFLSSKRLFPKSLFARCAKIESCNRLKKASINKFLFGPWLAP